uniref:CFEM domain-containing protein n=1 Tax=Syphacia muris TaxID=451379 RepID=A0A0N5AP72_9BILA
MPAAKMIFNITAPCSVCWNTEWADFVDERRCSGVNTHCQLHEHCQIRGNIDTGTSCIYESCSNFIDRLT